MQEDCAEKPGFSDELVFFEKTPHPLFFEPPLKRQRAAVGGRGCNKKPHDCGGERYHYFRNMVKAANGKTVTFSSSRFFSNAHRSA